MKASVSKTMSEKSCEVVIILTVLACLSFVGCRGSGNPPGDDPALPAGYSINGFLALAEMEASNAASIREAVKPGNELDFSSFLAILWDANGKEIARTTIASRSFSFSDVTPANNLRIEVVHSDVAKRKIRFLHFIDVFSSNLNVQIDEESTAIGLIIEKAKAQNKEALVSGVKSSFTAQLEAVKTAFSDAIKKEIPEGDSVEQDSTLVSKLTDAVEAITATPTIVVKGNGVQIANSDSTPDSSDHTDFGPRPRTAVPSPELLR